MEVLSNLGKIYKSYVSFDVRNLGKMLFGNVKCEKCGGKMKISKNKTYKGRGTTHVNGYSDNLSSPVKFRVSKQFFINQDIYEVKYFYKCCNCGETCNLDDI